MKIRFHIGRLSVFVSARHHEYSHRKPISALGISFSWHHGGYRAPGV